jgi:hypothetical protein
MWGRFQGPLRFPLDSNRLLSSPLADELLEIETPCTVSWDNNGISEALLLRASPPLNWGTVYQYITYWERTHIRESTQYPYTRVHT